MGLYGDHILPRVVNVVCGTKTNQTLRRRVCEGLHGEVIELGFGSGLSVPFYPPTVDHLEAVEPSDLAWRLAGKRLVHTSTQVDRSWLDGQSLPFADNSFDAALSTWTLCTIPDVHAALEELRRVLKPGATLHFVEHGLAPDTSVRRWQHRLEPLQKRIAGGCHLTRSVIELLTTAGFTTIEAEQFYESGAPKAFGALTLGKALSA